MPCCLLLIIALAFPRIVLICMWLFTHMLDRAFHGLLVPLLGFIFLPITTIVYAWIVNQGGPIDGINLIFLIIAVILDVGSHGGGGYYRRYRN